MSPTRRALFARVSRETATLTPDLARAIRRAFGVIASEMSEAQLAEAVASGSVERLLTRLLEPEVSARAFAPVRAAIRRAVGRETVLFQRDLPKAARVGTVGIAFDILNPKAIEAIRTLETRVITTLSESVRGAVRAHVELGLEAGVGPRAIARGLRAVIPLAPSQVRAVNNFERMLRAGDREALTRLLRDRRYDGTLRRAFAGEGLSAAQAEKMTAAYRRNMVAFNSEVNARTAALDSVKLGQDLSWRDAIDRGFVDGANLMKTWVQVDRPTKREEHIPLHGETVPFNSPYSNGQMIPGESDYNCACESVVFVEQ